ncbi:glycoside hydrolase family 3 N-terminal domain-containing protein [Desulfovulcanus sp.]
MLLKKINKYFFHIFLLLLCFYHFVAFAEPVSDDVQLKRLIGRMVIIGFDQESLHDSDSFVAELKKYSPGGVILFDHDFYDRKRIKNIRSPQQLKTLTKQLRFYAPLPLLIAVDQEGGKVARLKPDYGFIKTPSAKFIGQTDDPAKAKKIYTSFANQLSSVGINCDFAPVVDLAINPDNYVIVGLERSYGKFPEKVIKYARIFYDALHNEGIITVLKHFPGHGSSTGDSHKGFVDVTNTWNIIELEPYRELIRENRADMIMTAHVFNKNLDSEYPATLSKKINTILLRNKLGFKGVIVSDDLQMKAISEHYSLQETVTLAINAGVNMLIFGNQLAKISLKDLVNVIYKEVKVGHVSITQIIESNKRIDALFKKMQRKNRQGNVTSRR